MLILKNDIHLKICQSQKIFGDGFDIYVQNLWKLRKLMKNS